MGPPRAPIAFEIGRALTRAPGVTRGGGITPDRFALPHYPLLTDPIISAPKLARRSQYSSRVPAGM
jgi:hypothetical protein